MWGIEVLAAVGPNADAFAPPAATEFVLAKQILPFLFPVFSLTDSNRAFYGVLKRHALPRRGKQSHLPLSWAHPPVIKTFLLGEVSGR